jgi:hypothetical protein
MFSGSNAKAGEALKDWEATILTYARATMRVHALSGPLAGPLGVDVTFSICQGPRARPRGCIAL